MRAWAVRVACGVRPRGGTPRRAARPVPAPASCCSCCCPARQWPVRSPVTTSTTTRLYYATIYSFLYSRGAARSVEALGLAAAAYRTARHAYTHGTVQVFHSTPFRLFGHVHATRCGSARDLAFRRRSEAAPNVCAMRSRLRQCEAYIRHGRLWSRPLPLVTPPASAALPRGCRDPTGS